MTSPNLLWILPALALLAGGWFASAWFYKRKIDALLGQVKAVRQTAAEHAAQARRQIGQLQAELATRPPAPSAERERRAAAPRAAETRRSVPEGRVPDNGFALTAVAANGFAQTQVLDGSAGVSR